MKLALVGATGMVGEVMLKVLAERNFPMDELLLVASERSVGKKIMFKGKTLSVISLKDAVAAKPDIALFFSWRKHIARMGAKICCRWNYSYRQFFRLAHGARQKAYRS
jgi:aspartate-semialdehyde dehydrogenase